MFEYVADTVEVIREIAPDFEIGVERQHGDPVVRSEGVEKTAQLDEYPHKPADPAALHVLLEQEHDEVALPEEVAAYDGRRRELRFGAARPARYPDDRLDRRRLAADLDVEVVGAQLEHGLTTGVHDARVDQDARDVGPLDDARLLLRVEQRREARSDARRRDEPVRDAPGCGHRSCLSVYRIGSDFKNLTSSEWNRSGASRCGMCPTLSIRTSSAFGIVSATFFARAG